MSVVKYKVNKAQYSCGEYVYCYEDREHKSLIIKCEARFFEEDGEVTSHIFCYKLLLPNGKESNWMNSTSFTTTKQK